MSGLSSDTALAEPVAKKVGVERETTRRWLAQVDVNAAARPGVASDEQTEIKKLKAENHRLREDNEIFKARPRFSSPGNSTPATADHGVHR